MACICDLLGEARQRSRAFAISWPKLANHRVRDRSNATIFEQFVGELLAISPVGRADGAVEGVGIRALDLLHRAKHRCTDIGRGFLDISPVAPFRNLKSMKFRKRSRIDITEGFGRFSRLSSSQTSQILLKKSSGR